MVNFRPASEEFLDKFKSRGVSADEATPPIHQQKQPTASYYKAPVCETKSKLVCVTRDYTMSLSSGRVTLLIGLELCDEAGAPGGQASR